MTTRPTVSRFDPDEPDELAFAGPHHRHHVVVLDELTQAHQHAARCAQELNAAIKTVHELEGALGLGELGS